MTLQAGIIPEGCSDGQSACSIKANSLLQIHHGSASQTKRVADPGDYSEVTMGEGDDKEAATPSDNAQQEKHKEKEQNTKTNNQDEPEEKAAVPDQNGDQENGGKQEQIDDVPEGWEKELDPEGLDFNDHEGEGSSQYNNEMEGNQETTDEAVSGEEDLNYVCFSHGNYFSTTSEAEEYFHSQCVHQYKYTKALCDELSEKVFEKFVEDKDASWNPDSDVCAEINALLRADIARRHEIGLKRVAASPPKLELLQRSKRSDSGKSATSLDETNVLKAPANNHAPPVSNQAPQQR